MHLEPCRSWARAHHVEALAGTYELLDAARGSRPSAHLRDPLLPWFEVCRDSGLPVAGAEQHAEGGYAAAAVLAKSRLRHRARDRMRDDLLGDLADVVPTGLDDLRHDGWIAVIHADGNGVGRVFTDFPRGAWHAVRAGGDESAGLSLGRHTSLLEAFTRELEIATEAALGLAVRAVTGSGLTAAAGIAYVKPHHPFSAAYALAEELAGSANAGRLVSGPACGVRVHPGRSRRPAAASFRGRACPLRRPVRDHGGGQPGGGASRHRRV